MRKTLLLLCILSITIGAKAQSGKNWKEGYFYNNLGKKYVGFVNWEPPFTSVFGMSKTDYIFFKRTKKGEEFKVTSTHISALLIKDDSLLNDSFVVSKNKLFQFGPFLRVLFDADTTKIYCYQTQYDSPGAFGGTAMMTAGRSGTREHYYYGKDPDNVTPLEKANFIKIMSQLLASKANVVKKIKDKTFKIGNIDGLLYFYKTGNYPEWMIPKKNIIDPYY
jgi:hypothetical protein